MFVHLGPMTLPPTELAYIVDTTTAQLNQHLRAFRSASDMLRLLDRVRPEQVHDAGPLDNDPLDRTIRELCSTPAKAEPPLAQILNDESNYYRRRVTQSRASLTKLVRGATADMRLQNIVDHAALAARDEEKRAQRPVTQRLGALVRVVDDASLTLPDLFGSGLDLTAVRILVGPAAVLPRNRIAALTS